MAAAVCLAPQAQADPAPDHAAQPAAATQTATIADALSQRGISAELFAAVRQTNANPSRPARYTVRSGDSLSAIAGKIYHKQNAWTVLYWANHGTIHWANMISEGQVLKVPALPAKIPAAPSQLGPAPAPAPAPAAAPAAVSSSTSTSTSASAPARATVSGSYSGASGSYQACVIARESGGNSQVMNSSGHYGLYQFSASTWSAYGGSSAAFGHASVSEQNRVFNNAMAQGGQSNWSPYDGC
jgi:phage tail protein X